MGRLDGKVAFITGAARGQGRAHAVKMAQEGADIIAIDLCDQIQSVAYPMSTAADLEETVRLVEDQDRRIVAQRADVRDRDALQAAVQAGVAEFGHLDIVVANAGIAPAVGEGSRSQAAWHDSIDVLLTGVYHTIEVAIPPMVERRAGGSIVITSSTAGLKGLGRNLEAANPGFLGYTAAKHGVVGLMRVLAVELAPHMIRVNSVHPTTVDTPMIDNPAIYELFTGQQGLSREQASEAFKPLNALPIPWVEAIDISNAVLYLASDESRYVTGTTTVIDAGALAPYKIPHGS
jgi:SDR family mycofactocin-dependent oxidoreductase